MTLGKGGKFRSYVRKCGLKLQCSQAWLILVSALDASNYEESCRSSRFFRVLVKLKIFGEGWKDQIPLLLRI